jgi:hypothetical protein
MRLSNILIPKALNVMGLWIIWMRLVLVFCDILCMACCTVSVALGEIGLCILHSTLEEWVENGRRRAPMGGTFVQGCSLSVDIISCRAKAVEC